MTVCVSGIPVESRVNIFINSFGSIQETTMVIHTHTTNTLNLKKKKNLFCQILNFCQYSAATAR